MARNDLEERLINFAVAIIDITRSMDNSFASEHLSMQITRSSSSAALNYGEVQDAESRRDFIHKMKIAAKEAREAYFWLLVCQNANNYPPPDELLSKLSEIRRLLSSILYSSKKKFIPDIILSIFFLI